MSEKYTVNVADFTGKELDSVIAMLSAVAKESEKDVKIAEKFTNKAEQGAAINALAEAVGMRAHRVAEEDGTAFATPTPDGATPEVGQVIIVAMDYKPEAVNTTNETVTDEQKGDTPEESKTAEAGSDTKEGAEGENKGEGSNTPDTTPSEKNNEPVATGAAASPEKRYKGELVVRTANKIMNGRMYVEIFTLQASYVISPEEAKRDIK